MWSLPLRAKRTHFPSPSNQLALGFKISQKSLDSIGVKKSEKIWKNFWQTHCFRATQLSAVFFEFFSTKENIKSLLFTQPGTTKQFSVHWKIKNWWKISWCRNFVSKKDNHDFWFIWKNILNKLWLYSVMANWMKFVLLIFWIVSLRVIWQKFKLQFMIEKLTSGLLTPSSMSQSCAIFPRRPKCANLAQAGTNPYETVGNRQVKINFAF